MKDEPFFIVGFPRSGTTLLRLMLNSHSRIAVPFESDFIPRYYRALDAYGDLGIARNMEHLLRDICDESFVRKGGLIPDPGQVLARNPRSYRELVCAVFDAFAASHGKIRWGDKDPDNLQEMDVLWNLFPRCKFIHIVRDGRDVALSMRTLDWGSRNLPRVAQRWANQVALARRIGNVLGADHYLEVHFERLVRNPEQELRRICKFLGEEFEPGMLEYHRDSHRWIPSSSLQYHRTSAARPNPEKVELWRNRMDRADRVIFDQEAGSALDQFGYERSKERGRLTTSMRGAYYALVARW